MHGGALMRAAYGNVTIEKALEEIKIAECGRDRFDFLIELGYSKENIFRMLDNKVVKDVVDILARYDKVQTEKTSGKAIVKTTNNK